MALVRIHLVIHARKSFALQWKSCSCPSVMEDSVEYTLSLIYIMLLYYVTALDRVVCLLPFLFYRVVNFFERYSLKGTSYSYDACWIIDYTSRYNEKKKKRKLMFSYDVHFKVIVAAPRWPKSIKFKSQHQWSKGLMAFGGTEVFLSFHYGQRGIRTRVLPLPRR